MGGQSWGGTSVRLLVSVILIACGIATSGFAQEGCETLGGGFPYAVVRDGTGPEFVYRVSSLKANWKLADSGYHASAMVTCGECSPGNIVIGMIWLNGGRAPLVKPDVPALLSLVNANPSAPWPGLEFASAKPLGQPEESTLSNFVGWRYAFTAFRKNGEISHDVVNVDASDGCGAVSLRIETSPSRNARPIEAVNDLLSSLRIERTNLSDEGELRQLFGKNSALPQNTVTSLQSAPIIMQQFQDWLRTR